MEYLVNYDFTEEEITKFKESIPEVFLTSINQSKKLIQANLAYLRSIGVENIKVIFSDFYEMFLMEHSAFVEIFDKYDPEDLLVHLKNDPSVMEYL